MTKEPERPSEFLQIIIFRKSKEGGSLCTGFGDLLPDTVTHVLSEWSCKKCYTVEVHDTDSIPEGSYLLREGRVYFQWKADESSS